MTDKLISYPGQYSQKGRNPRSTAAGAHFRHIPHVPGIMDDLQVVMAG